MFCRFVFWGVLTSYAFLLCNCVARTAINAVDKWDLHRPVIIFSPEKVCKLMEEEQKYVYFTLKKSNATADDDQNAEFSVKISVEAEKPKILQITENSTMTVCLRTSEKENNYSFAIKGKFLGYSKVFVKLHPFSSVCSRGESDSYSQHYGEWYSYQDKSGSRSTESASYYIYEYLASVSPAPSIFLDIFTAFMALIVAINYVNMGCQLDLSAIVTVLKKPVGPVIGFVCQFIFMPLMSYGIGYLIFDDKNLRLGLFTLGCSPGGSMSNFWTLLFNGDLNLSVTMTFISTVAALGMMPLWIFTLGKTLFQDGTVTLPYINLAGSLIMLTLPAGIGMLIRRYKHSWAQLSEKIIRPFTIFCIIIGLTVGIYASRYIFFMFTWKIVAAGMSVAWGGYIFGALAAWISRLKRPQIIAVAIETAFQNGGVAFVMLILSLPQPDAAITAVPVVAQLIMTGLPMWCILITVKIIGCIKRHAQKNKEVEKKTVPDTVSGKVNLPEKNVTNFETVI